MSRFQNPSFGGPLLLSGVLMLLGPVLPGPTFAEDVQRSLDIDFSSSVLARRGEARLTHLELDARLQAIPEDARPDVVNGPARLEKLIEDQLQIRTFADRAIAEGALDDELVEAELYLMVSTWLAERYRDRIIAEQSLDDYTDQARELYQLDRDRFTAEPTVSFSHLLIANHPDPRARAAELLERIESGEDFAELAAEHSDDPSVVNNRGRFDEIETARLDERFRVGLAALEPGDVELVESGYGWHVVVLHDRQSERIRDFEEVADQLREEARQQHAQEIVERLLRSYYAQDLEIVEGGVAEVLERYPFE
ncbi:peptidylprolyl isomerase [Halomonas denitrificans]|nr:peptidylprolyl isomerase [Halomonas denitrificans]